MSKKSQPEDNKKQAYQFPSRFGSHSSMIDEARTNALNNHRLVVLKDEHGYYTTEWNRLDTGLCDPNRYVVKRIGKLFLGEAG